MMMLTAEGSSEVKHMLDLANTDQRIALAHAHPIEFDEWCDEVERGYRAHHPRAIRITSISADDHRWWASTLQEMGGSE